MKVAAYQAPLLPGGSKDAIRLIRSRLDWCEKERVEILCCPEAILGGLADDVAHPTDIALNVEKGELNDVLAPLASSKVTIILGFTEITSLGKLYNSAVVFQSGTIIGIYRKVHPAIRRSVYQAGDQTPVFKVRDHTFGIIICNDSNFPELARAITSQGASILFIPTNNGLPPEKADVIAQAKQIDMTTAKENGLWIIRADVAGYASDRVSFGSSWIVDPTGKILHASQQLLEDFLVCEVDVACRGKN